jgi:hypothetical protein
MSLRGAAWLAAGALVLALCRDPARAQVTPSRNSEPTATPSPGAETTPGPDTREVARGTWGGDHIRLEVGEKGAELEFDCAHGSIDHPILLDGQGRFEIKGVLVREQHGPVRVGHEPSNESAVYSGRLQGVTMTLWVTLSDSQETLGTYSLVHGEQARVRKCR